MQGLCELYMLDSFMEIVADRERSMNCYSSASHPYEEQDGELYRRLPGIQRLFDKGTYLPCHYFDYLNGTGSGGYARLDCLQKHS